MGKVEITNTDKQSNFNWRFEVPAEVTSNIISDYPVGTILQVTDESGRPLDNGSLKGSRIISLLLKIVASDLIEVVFNERLLHEDWEHKFSYREYWDTVVCLIHHREKEKGDILYIEEDWDYDEHLVIYSAQIHSLTIEEAVKKCQNLIDEIHEPIEGAVYMVKEYFWKMFKVK
jgi:hypothetical protein